MIDILIKNTVVNNTICDISIENGIFTAIEKNIELPAKKVFDAKGRNECCGRKRLLV